MPVKAATSMVQFRMDTNLKEQSEEIFKKLGLTMTSAFTIFAQSVCPKKLPTIPPKQLWKNFMMQKWLQNREPNILPNVFSGDYNAVCQGIQPIQKRF